MRFARRVHAYVHALAFLLECANTSAGDMRFWVKRYNNSARGQESRPPRETTLRETQCARPERSIPTTERRRRVPLRNSTCFFARRASARSARGWVRLLSSRIDYAARRLSLGTDPQQRPGLAPSAINFPRTFVLNGRRRPDPDSLLGRLPVVSLTRRTLAKQVSSFLATFGTRQSSAWALLPRKSRLCPPSSRSLPPTPRGIRTSHG